MQFTPSQMNDLGLITEACFERHLCRHVLARFPSFCAGKDDRGIQAVVRRALELANTYGLTRQVDVLTMLETLLCLENPAWSVTILSRPDLQGHQKAALLNHHMVFGTPDRKQAQSGANEPWPALACR